MYQCFFPRVTQALICANSAAEARAIFANMLGVPECYIFAVAIPRETEHA